MVSCFQNKDIQGHFIHILPIKTFQSNFDTGSRISTSIYRLTYIAYHEE